jgi:hypothetical protein
MGFPDVGSRSEEPFYFKDYSHVDVSRFIQDVDEFDWNPIYATLSVDERLDFFNETLRGVLYCSRLSEKR